MLFNVDYMGVLIRKHTCHPADLLLTESWKF